MDKLKAMRVFVRIVDTGSLTAAAAAGGQSPASVVRTLAEEIARTLRGRAANPRWIRGMMRHGYRGAAELAAGVDTLFAFAAESGLRADLKAVNERLWDIEDNIRLQDKAQAFNEDFVALARSVYLQNDERARIKKAINLALGSSYVEEKSYKDYAAR